MTSSDERSVSEPPASDGRVLALSDGVFAFALTLMIVTLDVPKPDEVSTADLAQTVQDQWPSFLSYTISFWVIGLFWFAHRRIYHRVVADDAGADWLNVAFLFSIAFLPYPTDMVGNYVDSRFAIVFYNISMIVTSVLLFALSLYIRHHPRITGGGLRPVPFLTDLVQEAILISPMVLSIIVSAFSLDLARYCWFLMAFSRPFIHRKYASDL